MKTLLQPQVLRRSAVFCLLTFGAALGAVAGIATGIRQFTRDAVPNYPLSSAQLFFVGYALCAVFFLMAVVYFGWSYLTVLGMIGSSFMGCCALWHEYGAAIMGLLTHQVGSFTVATLLLTLVVVALFGWAIYRDFFGKKRLVASAD